MLDKQHMLDVLQFAHDIKVNDQEQADAQIQRDIDKAEQLKED